MPAAGRKFLALKEPPLSVYNNVSACRRRKFFGFERGPSASLLRSSQYYKCLLQAEFFDLFGFERAPLSVHNNVSACLRQKNFGFERAPSASLLHTRSMVYNGTGYKGNFEPSTEALFSE